MSSATTVYIHDPRVTPQEVMDAATKELARHSKVKTAPKVKEDTFDPEYTNLYVMTEGHPVAISIHHRADGKPYAVTASEDEPANDMLVVVQYSSVNAAVMEAVVDAVKARVARATVIRCP